MQNKGSIALDRGRKNLATITWQSGAGGLSYEKTTPGPVNTVPGTVRGAVPALHPVAHPLLAHFSSLSSPETGVDSRGTGFCYPDFILF